MSNPPTTTKRVVQAICTAALLAAALRVWQAVNGSIGHLQAASEVGSGLSLLGVALAVGRLWGDARRSGRIFLCATAFIWAALVLTPLWRFGHLPAPLYTGTLEGAESKVVTGAAPQTAVYSLEVERPSASVQGDYIFGVTVDDESRKLRNRFSDEADVYALPMKRGQKATLVLEIGSAANVEVALPTMPWRWVRLAALLVIALACIGEAPISRSQPTVRGLWTAAIAVSAFYLVFLGPKGEPTGRAAVGAAMGAAAVGGALGALWGAVVRRRRSRRSAK